MAEYIEREAALKKIDTAIGEYAQHGEIVRFIGDCRASVIYAPAADVVSLSVFEQVKWERDTALATLEEHGIGLAQKFIKGKFPYEKPNKELIDRKQIRYCWTIDADGEEHDGVTLQSIIDKMPIVDAVEVKHGEWVEHTEIGTMNNRLKCSVCNWETVFFVMGKREYNYCPNCGAKMDKS